MVDKAAGKTVVGIQAPTDKTLVLWIQQHPTYEVLLPAGKVGKGMYILYYIYVHCMYYIYVIHIMYIIHVHVCM